MKGLAGIRRLRRAGCENSFNSVLFHLMVEFKCRLLSSDNPYMTTLSKERLSITSDAL
jgi:hypothetical protein